MDDNRSKIRKPKDNLYIILKEKFYVVFKDGQGKKIK